MKKLIDVLAPFFIKARRHLRFKFRGWAQIKRPGNYESGRYRLANDILVDGVNGITFTGESILDLNGKCLSDISGGNLWNYGIKSSDKLTIVDSSGGRGRVKGFRVGARLDGANSGILGIVFESSRYIGIFLNGNNMFAKGCSIKSIGGVDDEPYAIGIQVGESHNCLLEDNTIQNIYRQAAYTGSANGEGLGVNFSSESYCGVIRNCTVANDKNTHGTMGVFSGIKGGHHIDKNTFLNHSIGIRADEDSIANITGNLVKNTEQEPAVCGINAPQGKVESNHIVGKYETPTLIHAEWTHSNTITP